MNEYHQMIEGVVVKGKQLGRTIGFPTANIRPDSWEGHGPNGVYAAWCTVDGATSSTQTARPWSSATSATTWT